MPPVLDESGLRLIVRPRPRLPVQLALLLAAVLAAWGTSHSGWPASARIVALAALAAVIAICWRSRTQQRREFVISERGIDERRRRIDWLPRWIDDEIHLPGNAIARLYLRHSRSGRRWHIGQAEPTEASARYLRGDWCVEVEARGQCLGITGGLDFAAARSLLLDISRSLAGTAKEVMPPRVIPTSETSRFNDTPNSGELR